jgi:hypothetical protein
MPEHHRGLQRNVRLLAQVRELHIIAELAPYDPAMGWAFRGAVSSHSF